MKRFMFYFILVFLFVSCEKENLLEGEELAYNKYDDPNKSWVTIVDIRQINCYAIGFYISLNWDLIPKDVQKRGFSIMLEDPFGGVIYVGTRGEQQVKARCNLYNTYKVTLDQRTSRNQSKPHFFSFKTVD